MHEVGVVSHEPGARSLRSRVRGTKLFTHVLIALSGPLETLYRVTKLPFEFPERKAE